MTTAAISCKLHCCEHGVTKSKVMRYCILISSILLLTYSSQAQEFEYVYSQHSLSSFNDAVTMGDKIFIATNVASCSNAGVLVFDTLGNFLAEHILAPYFSVTPALTLSADSSEVFAITYSNESEEVYDVTQLHLYTFDASGNATLMVSDTVDQFASYGSLFATENSIVFNNGSALYFVYPDLHVTMKKDFSDVFGERDIDVKPVGEDWVVYQSDAFQSNDTILLYKGHPLFSESKVHMMPLSASSRYLYSFDGQLLGFGDDHFIRNYDLNTGSVVDSLQLEAGIEEIQFCEVGEQKLMLAVYGDDQLKFHPLKLDPLESTNALWEVHQKGYDWRLVGERRHAILLSDLAYSDHSYRRLSYPVIRRMRPSTFPQPSQLDISAVGVEILDSLVPGDCNTLFCEFDHDIPAVAKVTIENTGDLPISSYSFYSNSMGGSFCATGRSTRYFERDLLPGDTHIIYDTIYAYYGPVASIEYYAHVHVPNHRVEMDTSNNYLKAELFTTPVLDQSMDLIQVIPNPAADHINISGVPMGHGPIARIYHSSGQLVREWTLHDQQVSTHGLVKGVYILQLRQRRQVFSTRFVKL